MLKLLGAASRQICELFMLFDEIWLLVKYADNEPHVNGSWGFDDENGFVAFNFPPRIGKTGVNGCNAIELNWNHESFQDFFYIKRGVVFKKNKEKHQNYGWGWWMDGWG